MNVLFLTRYDSNGPSSRYRFYNYNSYFLSAGINPIYKPLLDQHYLKLLVMPASFRKKFLILQSQLKSIFSRILYLLKLDYHLYDLILIEKELFPNFPYFIEKLLLNGKKYALDYDDYVGASYQRNLITRYLLGSKINKLVGSSHFATVGNRWYYSVFNTPNLHFLPTVINREKYDVPIPERNAKVLSIVWIGSLTTLKYLTPLLPVIDKLNKRYGVRLKVIGPHSASVNQSFCDHILWDENTEVNELISADIGIMPLEDTLWEKGKCGLKLIQYIACALPVVSSPSPSALEILNGIGEEFIASNLTEWEASLEKLITDESLRHQYGLKARNRIFSHYTYQYWGPKYGQIIKMAVS